MKECPFHEPPVSERIKAIRERKQKEALAEDIKNAEQQVQPDYARCITQYCGYIGVR